MSKIMFSQNCGLQQAVFDGRKTMTRRVVQKATVRKAISDSVALNLPIQSCMMLYCPHHIDDILPIAQSYSDVYFSLPLAGIDDEYLQMEYAHKYWTHRGWSNKMFVASSAMPYAIKLTSVAVESLQAISTQDILREGVEKIDVCAKVESPVYTFDGCVSPYINARDAFRDLFIRVSGLNAWASNPWVYVYGFELIKNPSFSVL